MQNPPVGGNTTKPPEQYTLPPVYNPPAPVTPVAPVQPRYTPPSYTPPRTIDRSDAPQLEARKGPVRPKETNPDYSNDEWREQTPRDISRERDLARERDAIRERNQAAPVQPRFSEDYADDRHSPAMKQHTPRPGGRVSAHRVEAGETLTEIAMELYGYAGPRTIDRIVAANPGLHPDRIYIGQVIYLPSSSYAADGAESETPPEVRAPVRRKGQTTGANMHLVPISSKAKAQ